LGQSPIPFIIILFKYFKEKEAFVQVLSLTKEGSLKLKRKEKALYKKDFTDLTRSYLPGEWCIFFNERTKEHYAGFINLHVKENWPLAFMVHELGTDKNYSPWEIIQSKINKAIDYRKLFHFQNNCRLVYGENDDLPGLVIDEFENLILIQVNTAGLDQYRNNIKNLLQSKFSSKKIYLLDQPSYRQAECLPTFEEPILDETLLIIENGLKLEVSSEVLQKVGYYFDHRVNRQKVFEFLRQSNFNKSMGLDLFSYVGSWGLHLLKAGVEQVHFVDQGNFETSVLKNAALNHFEGRARFSRDDCFKFLDQCETNKQFFDVICSDPPAFTKNASGKMKALEGYTKLHTKVLKCLNVNSLAIIGSCTHYVSLVELDQTMQEAASRVGREIRLLDLGLQGPDHPIKSLNDKSNYIKYLLYFVK
jgi:23S rRNA (cytosine1962-C5)-methyltransferase